MKTIIVWYRNDLRVHDHPALSTATQDADYIVPVFIFDDALLRGPKHSSNRNRFLLECLEDLQKSLKKRGARLVFRQGNTVDELKKLVAETGAAAIYYSADYTPYSIQRDRRIKIALAGTTFRSFSGRLAVGSLSKLCTKSGGIYQVFTPFYKSWLAVQRRSIATTPTAISLPSGVTIGEPPKLADVTNANELSPDVVMGGETNARKRLQAFIKSDLADYEASNNDMAADKTSHLSPYLHFGCISPREIEDILPDSSGATAWHRQLAWREFYHYIILHFPENREQAFQEKYRRVPWDHNQKLLAAWQNGQTGYPIVDAAMRQLNREGWMHNRGRLIVGSFLTKDLWLDWRLGESYFYKNLLDGDVANNNGNWQWIASVGVDPAPVYRRLYNPASQQKTYDPSGAYTRRKLYHDDTA
jgi:deoxyribodipyrimidine photo-lyase